MTLRIFLNTLVELFFPATCGGCGEVGTDLCLPCASAFHGPFAVHRPVLVNAPPVYALADYRDTARTILLRYKERGRRDLAWPLGRLVAAVLPALAGARPAEDGTWWLVPAPSRTDAARRRAGPHMLRLARAAARVLAVRGEPAAVAPALGLAPGVRDSAGLGAEARLANLTGRIRVCPDGMPTPGTPVVLLDDVVTTGITSALCVHELTAAGLAVGAVLTLTAA